MSKSKGKGKSKDKSNAFEEGQPDGQVAEDSLLGFLDAANWWSGESLEALTDARHSGEASIANSTLEPECFCGRQSAASASSEEFQSPPSCAEGKPAEAEGCRGVLDGRRPNRFILAV